MPHAWPTFAALPEFPLAFAWAMHSDRVVVTSTVALVYQRRFGVAKVMDLAASIRGESAPLL